MKKKDTSRRDFIITGLMASVAAGCSDKSPFTPDAGQQVVPSGEKVKLLSADGEVIEVDRAFLKPVPDVSHHSYDGDENGYYHTN